MLDFIKIMLLSSFTLLTPEPVSLKPGETITIEGPVSAITEGAAIYLDISSMVPININGVSSVRNWEGTEFHDDFASVTLIDRQCNKEIELEFAGLSYGGGKRSMLIFSSERGVPEDKEYEAIKFKTDVELRDVLIYWKNYRK